MTLPLFILRAALVHVAAAVLATPCGIVFLLILACPLVLPAIAIIALPVLLPALISWHAVERHEAQQHAFTGTEDAKKTEMQKGESKEQGMQSREQGSCGVAARAKEFYDFALAARTWMHSANGKETYVLTVLKDMCLQQDTPDVSADNKS
jgi:hypothetical protein